MAKFNQDKTFNCKNLTNLSFITVNRNPLLDEEVSNKNIYEDDLNQNTILRFNQSLQKNLKISVENEI